MKNLGSKVQGTEAIGREKETRVGRLAGTAFQILSETAMNMADFTIAFLEAGYGASAGKIDYIMSRNQRGHEIYDKAEANKKCQTLIYRLKRDGLLTEGRGVRGEKTIRLTRRGEKKRIELRKKLNYDISGYPKEITEKWFIFIFDVPEKNRSKRKWLRGALECLGYQMIQKSVWAGQAKIPREMIKDIKEKDLLECIEVFEARKLGSLQE